MSKLSMRFLAVTLNGTLALTLGLGVVLASGTAVLADDVYGEDAYTRKPHNFGEEAPVPWSGAAARGGSGTVYFWTTDRGTYSFTDDERRVPARYRARAEARTMGPLDKYGRYTKIDPVATERLRAVAQSNQRMMPRDSAAPARGSAPSYARGARGPSEYLNLNTGGSMGGGGTGISVPIYGDGPPTVVENVRVKPRGSNATRNVTVIKRGDRVISVIKPQQNENSASFPREDDITNGW